jgi:serine/threonine protein kinase
MIKEKKYHRTSFHQKSINHLAKITSSNKNLPITPVPKIKTSISESLRLNIYEPQIINEEFELCPNDKLGGGSFGLVYKCINKNTKKEYAAKIESNDSIVPQIKNEYQILKLLENGEGIPKPILLKNSGMDTIMIMELLGPNLEDILQYTKEKKFTLKTSLMIFIQILSRLKFIHEKGIIHRDLKPQNFLVNLNTRDKTLYLIDFGLSKKYVTTENNNFISNKNKHIPFKKNRPIKGTVRYISLNTHKGFEQSRRDDIESLIYILIYFIVGELPWDNIKCKNKEEKYEKIFEKKNNFRKSEIFINLPDEIKLIYEAVLLIEFESKPNYDYYSGLIENLLNNENEKNEFFDDLFDWQKIEFMVEPIFMISQLKKKKKEEKENEEFDFVLEIKEDEKKNNDDKIKVNEKKSDNNIKKKYNKMSFSFRSKINKF